LDSLQKNYKTEVTSYSENINLRTIIENKTFNDLANKELVKKRKKLPSDILSLFDNRKKAEILRTASSNLSSIGYSIDGSKTNLESKQKNINGHLLALYDKFVIAYGCLMMFFIGAPLGAIIRKGGLGLPIIFAVLIFITFHFINTFGKRFAQQNGMTPFMGAWMSSFVLTPLAILLTYRATNDIGLINMDVVLAPVQKLFQKLIPNKNKTT